MKIGLLGTGSAGQTVAAKLEEVGHEVFVGTRDPAATLARTDPDMFGNPPFKTWREKHPKIELGTFSQAAAHGELVVNVTGGVGALEALKMAGEKNLAGKILVDVSNPLDHSKGRPPSLLVCNTDSLGEQIERAFPETKVVKTLNTMNADMMVAPEQLADGDHTVFVSGNDDAAKKTVSKLLGSFGWRDIVDLGDITTARGTEMLVPLWIRLFGALKTSKFQFKVVR